MNPRGFIYKIISPSGKTYVGSTINIQKRISEHLHISNLTREIVEHGHENMKVEILDKVSLYKLRDIEKLYIKKQEEPLNIYHTDNKRIKIDFTKFLLEK